MCPRFLRPQARLIPGFSPRSTAVPQWGAPSALPGSSCFSPGDPPRSGRGPSALPPPPPPGPPSLGCAGGCCWLGGGEGGGGVGAPSPAAWGEEVKQGERSLRWGVCPQPVLVLGGGGGGHVPV